MNDFVDGIEDKMHREPVVHVVGFTPGWPEHSDFESKAELEAWRERLPDWHRVVVIEDVNPERRPDPDPR